MNEATIQQKAMQDIFALDEAVSQFESFGSQLDLGLPTAEDDSPKSFSDMLEVNPSDEPLEYGENFASEGDDMQDQQTQKFVVDEFAKKIAELPDGNISPEDITGISAVIQMNNHITGDVRSFIQQTIDHAVQAQQQQNVSEAQPNGTVAQDIAKTGDAGAEAGLGDPAAMGDASIPAMDPIDPTAEPSLDANTGDDMGLGLDADVGDPLAGMDDQLAEPAGDAGIEGTEDPLADMGTEGDLGGLDDLGGEGAEADTLSGEGAEGDTLAGDDTAAEDDTKTGEDEGAEGGDDLDSILDADDDADAGESAEGDEKSEDKDEDFNFEAIATKARGLLEDTEVDDTASEDLTSEDAAAAEGQSMGEATADAELSDDSTEAVTECGEQPTDAVTECGEQKTDADIECDFRKKAAQVESIVSQARLQMTADKANAILESYHKHLDRESTLAKLDGVVNNLKQQVLTESIIKKYGEESKRKAMMESAAAPAKKEPKMDEVKSMFESTIAMIDNALATSKKSDIRAKADKVIAEFEAAQKPKTDPREAKLNAVLEGIEAKVTADQKFKKTLDSILEGVQKSQAVSKAASDIDKQLADIVSQVKNA